MVGRPTCIRAGLALTAVAASLLPTSARADQQWWWRKSVDVRQIATDNAGQSHSDRQFETVTAVTPGLSIGHNGPKLTAALSYAPTLQYSWEEGDPGLSHSLLLDGKATPVRNRFEVDFSGAIYQLANNTGSFLPAAPATRESDVNTVEAFMVTPRVLGRVGTRTDALLEYGLTYYNDGQDDTVSPLVTNGRVGTNGVGHRVLGRVDDFRTFKRVGWGVTGSYEDAPDLEEWLGQVDLAYRVNRGLTLLASGGAQEVNGLGLDMGLRPVWAVGFQLQPGTRTQISGSFGHRYDHDAIDASIAYALSPLSRVTLRYTESVVTARRAALERVADLNTANGTFVQGFSGLRFAGANDPFGTSSTNDASFDRRRLAFTVALKGLRNDVNATLYAEDRTFVGTSQEEAAFGLFGDLHHQATERLSLGIAIQAEHVRSDLTGSHDTLLSFGPQAQYLLTDRITLTAGFVHRERLSDIDGREFSENIALVGVHFTL